MQDKRENKIQRCDYAFELPDALIAAYPAPARTGSRLMCLNGQTGEIGHRQFPDFLELLQAGDVLVLNNTRVVPARLYGEKDTGGRVEILIERIVDERHALVHCKASKRPKAGQTLIFAAGKVFARVKSQQNGLLELEFGLPEAPEKTVLDIFNLYGHIPLPPYIRRADEKLDRERYQTVYAEHAGSVAAPTAGLHFDEAMLENIAKKGIKIAWVTLHVGAGTFQPVRVDNLSEHKMHAEYAQLPEATCEAIREAKSQGRRVIAVGTTTVRTLESAALIELKPFAGETQLFITPGFQFRVIDAMLTNFHLPESTLLMLVCAFGGYEHVMRAYEEAVEQRYRFFSYGDAMFLTRSDEAICSLNY